MTAIALGNIPLSLFICVLTNLASILTIPFLLNLFLQFGDTPIVLPVVQMLTGLTIKVLVPTAIGQMLRPFLKNAIAPYKKALSIFNQLIVLMIVLNAVSSSTARITQAGTAIIAVFVFMIVLHVLILAMNFAISRFIRLDRASTSAFTIHTSQKTLTVSYIVWAGHFATLYPHGTDPGHCLPHHPEHHGHAGGTPLPGTDGTRSRIRPGRRYPGQDDLKPNPWKNRLSFTRYRKMENRLSCNHHPPDCRNILPQRYVTFWAGSADWSSI